MLGRNGDSKQIPTTGQDATDEGLQRVLLGTQCMTVYKAVKKEADAASKLAIALVKGDTAGADAQATGRSRTPRPTSRSSRVLLQPEAIFPDNVKDVIDDGFTTAAKICTTAALKKACTANGISVMSALLSLRGVNKSFGAVHVLHDVDFDVQAGPRDRARG